VLDAPGLLANFTLTLNVILVHDTLLSRAKLVYEEVILVIPSLQVDYLATGQILVQ
jgi:lipopolysaccharide biosynthesis regulator YciM